MPAIHFDRLLASGLLFGLFALYLTSRLNVHTQCDDCVMYAARIQEGLPEDLFSGSHLIYLWLLNLIYRVVESFIPRADALIIAQVFNALMASLAIAAFYMTARSLRLSRWLSLVLSLVLAFSYKYWLFATDVEVHAPAVLFYLIVLMLAIRLNANSAAWKFVALGGLTALSILFHAFASLVPIVVVVLILLSPEAGEKGSSHTSVRKVRAALVYSATTAVCVLLPYLYVTSRVYQLGNSGEIISWIFAFTRDPGYSTRGALPLTQTLTLSATALGRAFIGVTPWVAVPGLGEILQGLFANKCVGEELYLVRGLSAGLATGLTILSIAALGSVGILGFNSLPGLAQRIKQCRREILALLLWLGLYALLISIGAPGSDEQWGMYWLPVFILILGLGLSNSTRPLQNRRKLIFGLLVVTVALLFVANLGNVLLQTDENNDLYLQRLGWYQANTAADDMIISAGGYKWISYTKYFLQARVELLGTRFRDADYSRAWQDLQVRIVETRSNGGRVFVSEDALDPEPCLANYGNWDLRSFSAFRSDIMPRLDCFRADGISVCEVVR